MSLRIPEVTKHPNEKFAIGLKYIPPDLDLDAAESISSCAVAISPSVAGGLAVVGNVVIDDDTVSQMVKDGVNDVEYYVTFLTTLSTGSIYEDKILVKIRNK
jgi:hypothetical protein